MNILFSPPDISELEIQEVIDSLKSGWITTGPKTKKFEKKLKMFTNSQGCICLNSATAAMETALRLFGIGEGDEVITTAYTYTASASIIKHVGAKIVLVDTEKDHFFMDYDDLERKISANTKAIIPVDIAGIPCDYDKIFEIVEKKKDLFQAKTKYQRALNRILILADSAHALGSIYKNKKIGSIADFTAFSFHAVKNLTTAEGGALMWNESLLDPDQIYKDLQILTLHGQTKDALTKTQKGSWEYDILGLNYKYNMADIMAAIGLGQLQRYPQLLNRRREIVELYEKNLSQDPYILPKHFSDDYSGNGHLYLLRIHGINEKTRNKIIEQMSDKGIATNVHYKPLPMLSAYKDLGFDIKDYPNAYHQYVNEISLPIHTLLTDEEVIYITNTLKGIVNDID